MRVSFRNTGVVQDQAAGKRKALFAASIAVSAVTLLAVGIGGTARSESASWPDGRVAALWPSFSSLPHAESGDGGALAWNGTFRRCIESVRMPLDYRCDYSDSRGKVGYACLTAADPTADLSAASINAVVAPGDPTFAAASPGQVCVSTLAYALSLG